MTDYGGKMFTPDAWMPKKKKEVKENDQITNTKYKYKLIIITKLFY